MPPLARRHLPGLALLALAPGAAAAQTGGISVEQPWTREAGAGATGAGYMTIRNTGTRPDRLLGASTPAAREVELHTHRQEDGVMRMRPVPDIPLPSGGSVTLGPGGLHLMLIGLAEPLRRGAEVPVTLRFEQAGEVRVVLAVQAAGARGPQHRH